MTRSSHYAEKSGISAYFDANGDLQVLFDGHPTDDPWKLNFSDWDSSVGELQFRMHPHPSGSSEPSPADLLASAHDGVPGVIFPIIRMNDDFIVGAPVVYQGRCLLGVKC
jgi:hypothetical protein